MSCSTRELRERLDLTQAELAYLLGCHQGTVAHWERCPHPRSPSPPAAPVGSSKLLLGWLEHVDPDRWPFIRRQRSWTLDQVWGAILTGQRKDDEG